MANRDDFPKRVKTTVALRAGYLCSNPDCRRPTSGPHSDPNKAIITGEAAHIRAASENGPRYDPNQTSDDRKAITNAIWLCGDCNKKIDTDWSAWTPEKILEMKTSHERWIAAEAMIPSLPKVSLETLPTLRLSPALPEITSEALEQLREQQLIIDNPNAVDLVNFTLTLNLPEAIARPGLYELPIGTRARIRSVEGAQQVSISGDATVNRAPPVLNTNHLLEADKIGPRSKIMAAFYTVKPLFTMPYELCRLNPGSDFEDPEKMDEHKICHFFLEGQYQFLLRNEYVNGFFFVPLLFKADSRCTTSYPVQDTVDPWQTWRGTIWRGATLHTGPGGSAAVFG